MSTVLLILLMVIAASLIPVCTPAVVSVSKPHSSVNFLADYCSRASTVWVAGDPVQSCRSFLLKQGVAKGDIHVCWLAMVHLWTWHKWSKCKSSRTERSQKMCS